MFLPLNQDSLAGEVALDGANCSRVAGGGVPVGGLLDGEEKAVFVGVRVRSRLAAGRSLFAHAVMIPWLVPRLAGYSHCSGAPRLGARGGWICSQRL